MNGLDDDLQSLSEKYDFLDKIGSGAMGVIYKARHKILDRIFAIKFMLVSVVSHEAVKRFEIEGKAASRLSHPNVVRVHDFGTTTSGHPYMVMEYVEGVTLADVISADGQIPVDRVLSIFDQVCLGLSHAHAHGIVHRDIKPSNIMLSRNDSGEETVRIMDFGVAKMLFDSDNWSPDLTKSDLTKTGETVGSPIYMSPEQARGLQVDQRSDLYSTGCVIYESLTGTTPFVAKSIQEIMRMHVKDNPVSLKVASMGKSFDLALEVLVRRLLEKQPSERFASADELRLALLQMPRQAVQESSGAPVAARPKKTPDQVSPQGNQFSAAVIGGGIGVIGVLGAALLYLTTHHQTPSLEVETQSGKNQRTISTGSNSSSKEKVSSVVPNEKGATEDIDIGLALPTLQEVNNNSPLKEILRNHSPRIDLDRVLLRDQLRDEDLQPLSVATFAQELILKNCPLITDNGLKYVSKLALSELDLGGTGIQNLGTIANMHSLTDLRVDHTNINKAGFKSIKSLGTLTNLDLSNTNLNDDDLPNFYALKNLHALSIQECPLSAEAVQSLQKHLPACKITFYRTATTGNKGDRVPDMIKDAHELEKIGQWQAAFSKWQDAQGGLEEAGAEKSDIEDCLKHERYCLLRQSQSGKL